MQLNVDPASYIMQHFNLGLVSPKNQIFLVSSRDARWKNDGTSFVENYSIFYNYQYFL